MACLTASEVVSGPGVNSKASWEVGNFGVMVIEWCPGDFPAADKSFHQKGVINQFPRTPASHSGLALNDAHRFGDGADGFRGASIPQPDQCSM